MQWHATNSEAQPIHFSGSSLGINALNLVSFLTIARTWWLILSYWRTQSIFVTLKLKSTSLMKIFKEKYDRYEGQKNMFHRLQNVGCTCSFYGTIICTSLFIFSFKLDPVTYLSMSCWFVVHPNAPKMRVCSVAKLESTYFFHKISHSFSPS